LVTSTDACIFETINGSDEHIIKEIMEERKNRPVIVYCTDTFKDLIDEKRIKFVEMNDTNASSSKALRSELDKYEYRETIQINTKAEFLFPLIIATSAYGMVGFDYRSPQYGITLIILKSFAHEIAAR